MIKVLRRAYQRHIFNWIFFGFILTMGILLGIGLKAAWGATGADGKESVPSTIKPVKTALSVDTTTTSYTTSTTTTTAPKPHRSTSANTSEAPSSVVVENTNAVRHSSPSGSPSSIPQGDWVAQCHVWAAQAGIELPDAAIKILERESHCNPNAQNPTSSACGIAQNIRGCGSNGYGHDPISQLQWFKNYCFGRYGSFEAAYEFWLKNHWY